MSVFLFSVVSSFGFAASAQNNDTLNKDSIEIERHHEDPTKVITKIGIGYNDQATLSGSLSVDKTKKLNANINDDASHWKIGGSWLFDLGIVNVNVNHNDFDHGGEKDGYSIGTIIPLSTFNFTPFDSQVFFLLGANKNEGEYAIANPDAGNDIEKEYVLAPNSSKGAYVAYFSLKPLSDKWTLMSFGGTSRGSDDYKGYWFGVGVSYKIDEHQSFNSYAFLYDDDYDSDEKIGFSYKYEFDGVFID